MSAGVATPAPAEIASPDPGYARKLRNSLVGLALVVAMVIGLLAALPGLDEVSAELTNANAGWLWAAVGFEYLSSLGYVVTVLLVFYRGPRLMTYRLGWSELAANSVLPAGGLGGLGLGAWVLSRQGFSARRITERSTIVFLITSVVNVVALIIVGLALWLGLLSGPRDIGLTLIPALVGILAIVAVIVAARLADRIAATVKRPKLAVALESLSQGVNGTLRLMRRPNWRLLGPVAYFAFDVVVLYAAFAAIGESPSWAVLTMAFLFGQMAGMVPIPGGIGAVDGGLVAALVLYGVALTPAAAAVLLYRVIALALPALLGTIAFMLLRRGLDQPITLRPPHVDDLTAEGSFNDR